MTGRAPHIWSYGVAMMDVVVRPLDAWPARGRLAVCKEGLFLPGGVGLNTAVAAARLGGRVGLLAGLGRDAAGDGVMSYLQSEGVDTSLLIRTDQASSGFCIVAVASDGEKSLIAHLGANRCLTPERIRWDQLQAGSFLHLGGCFAVPELSGDMLAATLAAGRRQGCRLSMESAWDVSGRWLQGVEPVLPWVEILMTSDNEAEGMTGLADPEEACRALASFGPQVVIVKAGSQGCYVWRDGDVTHFPAFAVEVVDATGAGDCFCGGLLVGLSQRWDLERCTRFANAVAAMNMTRVGATAGVGDMAATLAFMATARPRDVST